MTRLNDEPKTECPNCRRGQLMADEVQFSVDRGSKILLVESVPALVCSRCLHRKFDDELQCELITKAEKIFAKSSCTLFAYQLRDLVRNGVDIHFELFDIVRIKDDVNTWDMYDEDLLPGMTGTVVHDGERFFHYLVEFRVGRRKEILQVEIDRDDLELVQRVGQADTKLRFRKKAGSGHRA